MLDLTSPKGRLIDAAMRLAAERGWRDLTLDEIAKAGGVNLAEFRPLFQSKAQILAAFTRAVDDAVLAKIGPDDAGASPRDRLFDVLMTRLETMQPYKAALRRIASDLRYRPGDSLTQFGAAARSTYWMLAAAGLDAEGPRGAVYLPGLMGVYARTFDIWLEDDDPGMARTMAALDSRLRRGERAMRRVDDMIAAARNMASSLRGRRRRERADDDMPSPEETVTPAAAPASNASTGPADAEPGPRPAM
jgi:AcrR family transcriptional regulator